MSIFRNTIDSQISVKYFQSKSCSILAPKLLAKLSSENETSDFEVDGGVKK